MRTEQNLQLEGAKIRKTIQVRIRIGKEEQKKVARNCITNLLSSSSSSSSRLVVVVYYC